MRWLVVALWLWSGWAAWALEPDKKLHEYLSRHWNVEHGLPHPVVCAVAQTSDGYMWAATEYGLARFNGARFTVCSPPELTRPTLNCLLSRQDGSLWIGSEGGGLVCYQEGRFTGFTPKEGLLGASVHCLCEDSQGRLWIGTSRGLNLLERNRLIALPPGILPTNLAVFSIVEDRHAQIWLGTARGLFGPLTTNTVMPGPVEALGRAPVHALCTDGQQGLWVGSDQGLARYRQGRVENYASEPELKSRRVLALHRDRQGVLWVGTSGGLVRWGPNRPITERSLPVLDHTPVRAFFEDAERNFWIASGDGLHLLRDTKFASYSMREGLAHEVLNTLLEGEGASLWLGTVEGGLYEMKDGRFEQQGSVPRSASVTALCPARAGGLWVGTRREGLFRLADRQATRYSSADGLVDQNIAALCEETADRLWIGTSKGLHRRQAGRIEFVPLSATSNLLSIRDLRLTKDGTLWVASNGGLHALRAGITNHFGVADGLPDNLVYCLAEDRDGRLWAGTAKGLACRLEDGWHSWPRELPLERHHVFWVADDGQGFIWYSTPWTMFRVSLRELLDHWRDPAQPVAPVTFDRTDGLLATECLGGRQGAGCQTRDGRLWFPTRRGLAVVDPTRLPINRVVPPVHLERVLVNGHPQPLAAALSLPAGSSLVEFHYAGLSFAAPDKVRFRYRLAPVDSAWVEAEDRRVATYANLHPGQYRFQVTACNNDGVWNNTGASLAFAIAPRFYETAWFSGIGGLSLLGGLLGWHRWRLRRVRAQGVQLERLVQERTRSLEERMQECLRLEQQLWHARKMEAVGRLAAGVAHYFNNLLTIIQGYAELLREDARADSPIAQSVEPIQQAAQRAASLVNQLLAFSRQNGQSLRPVDLNRLLSAHARALRQQAGAAIQVVEELDPRLPLLPADSTNLEQLLGHLTANACDAMPHGGVVRLRSGRETVSPAQARQTRGARPGLFAVLEVSDTGRGMPPEVLAHVFEPFFTTKDVGEGTGLSMAAVYGTVEQHQGWIELRSAPGQGTTVRILLPLPDTAPLEPSPTSRG